MEIPSTYKKPNPNITDRLHLAAFDVWTFFGKEKGKYGMYLGYISRIGISEAYSRIAEQRQQGIKEVKFFFRKLTKK